MTGDDKYLDVWRKQIDKINSNRRMNNGRWQYPRMYGDQGWYAFTSTPYDANALELYCLSQRDDDAKRAGDNRWLDFLAGKNADYPVRTLENALDQVRRRVANMRNDKTTPDTRLADDPMGFNPATAGPLLQLTMGGIDPGRGGNSLTARLRYFDAEKRRPGLPEDVAALVERMSADEAVVTFVNISQLHPRTLIVQGGAYGEHQLSSATNPSDGSHTTVRLAPGAGGQVTFRFKRHANQPTFNLPW